MKTVELSIEGEDWTETMTEVELVAWDNYAETHKWLFRGIPYRGVLRMFLANYRAARKGN